MYLKHLKSGGLGAAKRGGGGDVVGVRMLRRVIAAADDEERCGARFGLAVAWLVAQEAVGRG